MHPSAAVDPAAEPSGGGRTRLPIAGTLVWGGVVALAMSTQLLFQPFVWRNFGWDEILGGWAQLAGERLSVSLAIALAIALGSRLPVRTTGARAATLGAAILLGAPVGELALLWLEGSRTLPSVTSVLARACQWAFLATSVAALYYLWRRTDLVGAATQAAALRRVTLERQIVQARLQALRSQIEPHFLFNTLATVRRLHRTEHDQGALLLQHFLAYLRSSLPRDQERATLGHEVELVQAYLGVVSARMTGRLALQFDVPEALRPCAFPALALATLVENAIKHGIAPAPLGGAIHVQARAVGQALEVTVADTGVGFSGSAGSGIGLANIRSRLRTLYGKHGALVLEANLPNGVRATVRLPLAAA